MSKNSDAEVKRLAELLDNFAEQFPGLIDALTEQVKLVAHELSELKTPPKTDPPVFVADALAAQREPSSLDSISSPTAITSIVDFTKCIAELSSRAALYDRLYFRGQYTGYAREKFYTYCSSGRYAPEDHFKNWKLEPSLARIKGQLLDNLKSSCGVAASTDAEGRLVIQRYLVQRLKRLAEHHLPSVSMGSHKEFDYDFMTWLSIAQHHKVPTFLMDWTVNPLVGLYFAVEDAFDGRSPGFDGDVWVFDLIPLEGRPDAYSQCFLHLDELALSVPNDAKSERRKREELTMKSLMMGIGLPMPIAVVPRLTAKRIDSQAARFVYWNGSDDLLSYTQEDKGIRPWRRLKKLCWIPKEFKPRIAKELAQYRIHPGTIDADLDGYARFLKWGGL